MDDSKKQTVLMNQVSETLIEENRLVNLPRTISRYTEVMYEHIKHLRNSSLTKLNDVMWMPKSVEEVIIYRINEMEGYTARVVQNSEYDSLIEIISLEKLDILREKTPYETYKHKVMKRKGAKIFKNTKVPTLYIPALKVDLSFNEDLILDVINECEDELGYSKVRVY